MGQPGYPVVHVAHNRITAAANSAAIPVAGATKIGWQYWGSDGSTAQVDLTSVAIELQGRIVEKDNVGLVTETMKAGPWVTIGDAQTAAAGTLIRDVTPIEVTEVRIAVTSMSLGSATDLIALLRLS